MTSTESTRFSGLERRRAWLFLAAGGLLAVFAAMLGIQELTATVLPQNVVGSLGFAIGFLGLLGLYPSTVDESPRLAATGALLAIFGAGGYLVAWGVAVAEFAELTPPEWLSIANVPILAGMTVGFLVFAIAVHRSDAYSRRLALLLLVPAALFAMNVLRVEVQGPENVRLWLSTLFAIGQALAYLEIGMTLRGEPRDTTTPTRTTDSTA